MRSSSLWDMVLCEILAVVYSCFRSLFQKLIYYSHDFRFIAQKF